MDKRKLQIVQHLNLCLRLYEHIASKSKLKSNQYQESRPFKFKMYNSASNANTIDVLNSNNYCKTNATIVKISDGRGYLLCFVSHRPSDARTVPE